MTRYIGAIDQGTTSTRFIIYNHRGEAVGSAQKEHRQIYPKPGWVEHDPLEIWHNTEVVVQTALARSGIRGSELAAVGITNQRETTVVWDRLTGKPYCNAIVWQCTRTAGICNDLVEEGGQDRFRETTGLPVATYFSGPKLRWIMENIPDVRPQALRGNALFGTIESWLIWWLTGGPEGGRHVTDVTNASRTLLMDLKSLQWDKAILELLEIPPGMLPEIVPSSDTVPWGLTRSSGPFGAEIPVCGAVGDQQAALIGQACFRVGEAKNTYGTGCFLLLNTGTTPVVSRKGLLTTVGYRFGRQEPVYCLEGSVAVAGALVQWFRDNLGLIASAPEIETLAATVADNGGAYFVPAFSGLFAPYWRSDARGAIVGLTGFVNKGHLARAVLEANAYQARDIVDAMVAESGVALDKLKVDGGMVVNELLMQFQADILDVPVIRPKVIETTALGAAYAAGLGVGFWSDTQALRRNWAEDKRWTPAIEGQQREALYAGWRKAVERTLNWA
jgi:glycerol kinase